MSDLTDRLRNYSATLADLQAAADEIDKLTEALAGTTQSCGRCDDLTATLDRVRALHQPQTDEFSPTEFCTQLCADEGGYRVPWPCPTVSILNEGTDE